jgi:hypothetical protein
MRMAQVKGNVQSFKDPVYDIDLREVRHNFNVWRRNRAIRWFFIAAATVGSIWCLMQALKEYSPEDRTAAYVFLSFAIFFLGLTAWQIIIQLYRTLMFACPSYTCNMGIDCNDDWICPFCAETNDGRSHSIFSKCKYCPNAPHAHQCPWCGFVFALLFTPDAKIFKFSKRPDVNLQPRYPAPRPEVSGAYDAEYYTERALCLYKQQFPSGCFLVSVDPLNAYQLVKAEIEAQEPVWDRRRVLSDAVYSALQTKAQQMFVPYGLPDEQRMEHHWVVAASGAGKTQMLQAMIADDIEKGRTVFVMDSQRDMIQKLSNLKHGMETILIDPEDTEYPPAIALFDIKTGDEAEENTLIELYQYVFTTLLSAGLTLRQDVLFSYVLRLVFTIPDANIFTLLDIFKNGEAYQHQMGQLDEVEHDFFRDEYFQKHYAANKTQIIQRLHGILKNKTFRRIFANTKSKIKFTELINKPCVILVNTSKAQLGDDGSAIFGRFILSLLTMAIYQRAKIPEPTRRPIYLYIDEGGDYGNDKAFTNIISQCRKYKAGLIFCNQYLGQLSPEVLGSMMACAIKCVSSLEDPTETKKMANSLRVDDTFIRNLRKDKTGSQWALYVRGQNTIQVRVPFGVLEAKEKRLDFDSFKAENRSRYCVRPAPKQTTTVYRAGKRVLLPQNAPDESFFD